MSDPARADRIGRIVGGVVRQALADTGAAGIWLLQADTPEGRLAAEWCRAALGEGRVFTGQVDARVLRAHPVNKTVLLLEGPPDAPLLPLGDLYASEVEALAGEWGGPEELRVLAEAAGGIAALDGALRRWAEGRRALPEALAELPEAARADVASSLREQHWYRGRAGLVPKLGGRTVGIDLWE